MPGLDSIVFDLDAWRVTDLADGSPATNSTSRAWINSFGDELSLHLFERAPDLPAPLADIAALRSGYRTSVAAQGGGIVSVDIVTIAGLAAVETVFKFRQQPNGMTYVGAITLPFQEFSLVVRVICQEMGITGLRDSAVLGRMLAAGTVTVVTEGAPRMVDWAQDRYDSSFAEGSLRNRSDDEEWDVDFPDHPLSRVRGCLKTVRQTCRCAPDLKEAAPFGGPRPRSWWRRLTRG